MARQTDLMPPATGRTEHRITLLGKPGCHLWEERSILGDPELLEEYGEQIPVVLIDGRQHTFWRVDEQRLRAALSPS